MPPVSFTNLLWVSAVAVLAPLLLGFVPRLRIPAVVLEIVAGIVLGPAALVCAGLLSVLLLPLGALALLRRERVAV